MRCPAPRWIPLFLVLACDAQPDAPKTDAAPAKAAPAKAEVQDEPKVDPALHEGYDKLCNAVERSGLAGTTDPSERAMKLAEWIRAEVKSTAILELLGELATMDPSRKAQRLRDAAKAAGVDPCPLADET